MIVAEEALLPSRYSSENIKMFVPFVSDNNNANNNIVSRSRTGNTHKGILFKNRQTAAE